MNGNPFEVLRLDPGSSEEEVVRQAGRLRQRAPDEATLDSIRRAVQALTCSSEGRELLALLAHPGPGYATPVLDRLARAFRRPPVATEAATVPAPDLDELAELLGAQLGASLELPPLPFEAPGSEEAGGEIQRQTAEAVWQSMLANPGA
jgi:hypothetical protein